MNDEWSSREGAKTKAHWGWVLECEEAHRSYE